MSKCESVGRKDEYNVLDFIRFLAHGLEYQIQLVGTYLDKRNPVEAVIDASRLISDGAVRAQRMAVVHYGH